MMKYKIKFLSSFKKQLKQAARQGKDIDKRFKVVEKIAQGEELDEKYRDHQLQKNKYFNNCRECHIEPDWLLIYKINKDELVLYLVKTGSHSEVFN